MRAADGFFTVGATSMRNWEAFCRALGHPEWQQDERFRDNPSRHRHREQLIPLVEAVTATQSRAHWIQTLQAAGVPCGAIQRYDEVTADPHLQARGFFWDAGEVRQVGNPMRFEETPVRRDHAGPRLGQHSAEVLRELGRSPEQIADLRSRGAIVCP